MVPKSFVKISDSVKVSEPRPEIIKTEKTLIQLDTEDVLLETETSLNVDITVDQTTMTNPLMLMLNAQEHHGDHIT
jgi:hypothetical protein